MRTRVSGLLSVVLLVLLMGGYAMAAHGAGRMGEEHLGGRTSLLADDIGPQFRISAGTHPVGVPSMAFNPQTNLYLVVWADERSGVREAWGNVVDASGNQGPVGGHGSWVSKAGGFRISEGVVDRHVSVACGNDEYLVVWGGEVYEDTWVTYGQRVSDTGRPTGEVSQVLSGYRAGMPSHRMIVHNSQDDEYLVVEGGRAGRVSASGQILGDVEIPADTQAASYNSVRNEYLVLYYIEEIGEYPPDALVMIRAQRLSNTGVALGDPIDIAGPWHPYHDYGSPRFISYNPSADQYLVSWDRFVDTMGDSYCARLLSGDGTWLGDPFSIEDDYYPDSSFSGGPVVYNSVADEYLATWGEGTTWSGTRAAGARRISGTGQLLGDVIPYSGDPIGYCPQADRYLLCRREDSSVYCRYLTGDGSAVGVERSLVGPPGHQSQLAISYHEALDQYLVAWRDTRSDEEGDMYAQRVGADGTLWGGNFSLGDTYSPSFPAVAYNEQGLEWLVVWQERAAGGQASWLRGQRVSASGDFLGDRFDIDVAYYQYDAPPAIAYNGTENQYLTVWSHTDAWELHGMRMAADGTVLGDAILLATGVSPNDPDVAYNSVRNEYLVVWEEDGQIYTRSVLAGGGMSWRANALGDGDCRWPSIAYNPQEDQYLLVWTDTTGGTPSVRMQRLSGDGTLLGEPLGPNGYEQCHSDADVVYNLASNAYTAFFWIVPFGPDFYCLTTYQVDAAGNWEWTKDCVGHGEFFGIVDDYCEPCLACSSSQARCMLIWREVGDRDIWGSECGVWFTAPTPTPTSTTGPTGMPTATLTNTPLPTNTPTATVTNTPSAHLYLPLVFKRGG